MWKRRIPWGRKPKVGGKEKAWKNRMGENEKGSKLAGRESEPNERGAKSIVMVFTFFLTPIPKGT